MTKDSGILAGKRILITGGSMGIGYACAESCLQSGASVMVCARTEKPLADAVASFRAKGYERVSWYAADVSQLREVDALLEAFVKIYGGLDGVIHCAAILGPIGPAIDVAISEWFETIRVNLLGSFLVARQSSICMRGNAGGGRIVLLSGGGASGPFPNYSAYACSKVAVVRLTETLAQELLPLNIEINCLGPGFVITRLHSATLVAGESAGKEYLERTKREIESGGIPPSVPAQAAVFLLSDRAKGITGKFVAAPYDGWADWPKHLDVLKKSDVFTLRRIVPKDRGMDWQ